MQCKACGAENAAGAVVCSSCGGRLGGSAGVQVWPKDPNKLTEFRPAEDEQPVESGRPTEGGREEAVPAPVLEPVAKAVEVLAGGAETGEVPTEKVVANEAPAEITPVEEAPIGEPLDGEASAEEVQVEEPLDEADPVEEALAEENLEEERSTEEALEGKAQAEEVLEEEPPVEGAEAEESAQVADAQETVEDAGAPSASHTAEPKKSGRAVIAVVAIAIVIAAILGVLWFAGHPQAADPKSYAGEWTLVEGDEPSLSRSNVSDLKNRGLECTLVLEEEGSGTLELFGSDSMAVEWSIGQDTKEASGTVENVGKFDLRLTDGGIALVDTAGKAMYFERK